MEKTARETEEIGLPEARLRDVRLNLGLNSLRRRAFAISRERSYNFQPTTTQLTGGWKTVNGQRLFLKIRVVRKRVAHCTSCGSFHRSKTCPGCKSDPDLFVTKDTEACRGYHNRTHDPPATINV